MTAAYEQDGTLPRPAYRIRNTSEATAALRLVEDADDMRLRDGDFMREAKGTCEYCGFRALSLAGHPSCAAKANGGA